MADVQIRDPTIKLFGKMILLSSTHLVSGTEPYATSVHSAAAPDHHHHHHHDGDAYGCKLVSSQATVPKVDSAEIPQSIIKETSGEELTSDKNGDGSANHITDQTSSEITENLSVEIETSSPKTTKSEELSETSISPDKTTLKKPDKILPCPRCNSMDTKFCYYNNYNVNQPRHFCKNCQRYWTAGGTMRNVPVGAGRRKNKNSACSHIHHLLGSNGTFLTFGSDPSISDSVQQNCKPNGNGFQKTGDNGDDHSSKSSITATNNSSERGTKSKTSCFQQPGVNNFLPFPPQLPSIPGLPWPYSCTPPMGSTPPFCPPGFPVTYYSASPYWGCSVPLPPSWSLPSLNHNVQNPIASFSVLGKHSRDGEMIENSPISQNEELIKQKGSETSLWTPTPRILRVGDPNEAAKSSIWSTLGIKNGKLECPTSINGGGGGLFTTFQSKGKEENNQSECYSLLQANPAAFSRALKFRETV